MSEERFCDCGVLVHREDGSVYVSHGPRGLDECPVMRKMERLGKPGGAEQMLAEYKAAVGRRARFLEAPESRYEGTREATRG